MFGIATTPERHCRSGFRLGGLLGKLLLLDRNIGLLLVGKLGPLLFFLGWNLHCQMLSRVATNQSVLLEYFSPQSYLKRSSPQMEMAQWAQVASQNIYEKNATDRTPVENTSKFYESY